MTPLACLIVEDEPLAAAILEDYINQTPFLRFAGRCPDAIRAGEALLMQQVDVLLLDINLPGIKGLDFLRSLARPPQTILTTAYPDFALEGYSLNVVDYLLKPVAFERFMQAAQKLRLPEPEVKTPASRPFFFFNVNKTMHRVWLDEIVYVESLKEYVRIALRDGGSLVTKAPLSGVENLLVNLPFARVHRSFLVSLNHVEAFSSTALTVNGKKIPIGRQYKEQWESISRNFPGIFNA